MAREEIRPTLTSEMVERISKRLAKIQFAELERYGAGSELFGSEREYVREQWRQHEDVARAVLDEMREPTEPMAFAGRNTIAFGDRLRIRPQKAVDAYRAMIKAALS